MAALTRKDFMAAPTGVNRNNAKGRGWGNGWPHCQSGKWAKVQKAGVIVIVRREVAELVATLFVITELMGYDIKSGQTWGAACRAIRGTQSPSNHSWALAVDINSLANPMQSTFKTDIPPEVVKAWWDCGWYWGGWYQSRPDAMHFEYVRRPQDVEVDLRKAKAILAELLAPKEPPAEKPSTPAGKWRKRVDAKPGTRTISRWDVGPDVGFVQRFIGTSKCGPDDDHFGDKTVEGVRWYQKDQGLKVDGIVGDSTWRAMGRKK